MKKGWSNIERLINEADNQEVEQAEMPGFLKKHFNRVLDVLEDLVLKGIDLSDWQVVSNLKNLELALHQIPQRRIYSSDTLMVLDEFEEFIERFYMILSLPKQDAESSFTSRWIISQFESFLAERGYLDNILSYIEDDMLEEKEILSCFERIRPKAQALVKEVQGHLCNQSIDGIDDLVKQTRSLITPIRMMKGRLKELEKKKNNLEDEKEQIERRFKKHLELYLTICDNLKENGSNMIQSMIVTVIEDVANVLYSDAMWGESKLLWEYVITLLEQNNPRIIQREGRLAFARDILSGFSDGSHPNTEGA